MALRLPKRELPAVEFRRNLPDYLGPKGEGCFISFEARAGGSINPRHVEVTESSLLKARVMSRKNARIEDDEAFVKADDDAATAINKARFGALYDACVIEWTSNIQVEGDDGKTQAITCDRSSFMDLIEVHVPEIARAITDLEKEVLAAGKIITEEGASLES